MLKKFATQNHKYLFFTRKEKEIKDHIKNIINKEKENFDVFISPSLNEPFVIYTVISDIVNRLTFLYSEQENSPYIEVKFLNFSLGNFKIGEPRSFSILNRTIDGFISSQNTSYEVAEQIVEIILDNLFDLINITRTSS